MTKVHHNGNDPKQTPTQNNTIHSDPTISLSNSVKKGLNWLSPGIGIAAIFGIVLLYFISQFTQQLTTSKTPATQAQPTNTATENTLQYVQQTLSDMQVTLATIRQHLDAPPTIDTSALSEQLATIAETVNAHTDTAISSINKALSQNNQPIIDSLSKSNSILESVVNHLSPTVSTDASLLPFDVLTIDLLQHKPIVSVRYAHHTTALEPGMDLASWRLEKASFQKQTAEFIGSHGQHVQVSSKLLSTPGEKQ